jgi:hypothetical protein
VLSPGFTCGSKIKKDIHILGINLLKAAEIHRESLGKTKMTGSIVERFNF